MSEGLSAYWPAVPIVDSSSQGLRYLSLDVADTQTLSFSILPLAGATSLDFFFGDQPSWPFFPGIPFIRARGNLLSLAGTITVAYDYTPPGSISLDATVLPEPASMMLLAGVLGLGMAGGYKLRSRDQD